MQYKLEADRFKFGFIVRIQLSGCAELLVDNSYYSLFCFYDHGRAQRGLMKKLRQISAPKWNESQTKVIKPYSNINMFSRRFWEKFRFRVNMYLMV